MPGDEQELLRRLKLGDEAAQRGFWDRYRDVVYRHVRFHEARDCNEHDAEDITAEVFYRAFRGIGSFDGRAAFRTWLLAISRHAAVDFYRPARHQHEETPADPEMLPRTAEAAVRYEASRNPLQEAIDHERRDLFLELLAQLGEEQRAVATCRIINGLSVAETAALMSKTEGAVKMLLLRALRSLTEMRARAEADIAGGAKEVERHGR